MADFEYVDVNGRQIRVRPRETAQEIDEYGNFHRQPNRFTEGFGEGKNPVEKDRYILFWAKGCNWSNRAAIARELLGLEDAVKVEIVDWTDREENLGWEFVNSPDHINPETGAQFLSELYYNADEEYTGRTTVPAFVDYKTKKVVNNDYHWLTNHLETAFRPFHKKGAPDLYPEELRPEIDKLNKWLFENVNNAGASYLYSYPYDKISYVFVTKKGGKEIKSFEDAAGLSFEGGTGISVSNAVEAWNEKNPDKAINITYSDADTSVFLQHVADGSQDFTIIDLAMYNSYMEEFNYDVQKNDIPEDEAKMIAENSYAYYIFPQDQKDLREQVDKALKELKEDGTLTEISKKWYGQDTAPEDDKFEETIN